MRLWELRAATMLARILHRRGRAADARSRLAAHVGVFEEGFETGDVIAARALLAEMASPPAAT